MITGAATGIIAGFGFHGYVLALAVIARGDDPRYPPAARPAEEKGSASRGREVAPQSGTL